MKRILISSAKYPGTVETVYNEKGKLLRVDFFNANLTDGQKATVLTIIPADMQNLELAFKGTSAIIVQEGFEFSFSDFWNKYNLKRNKKDAEAIWKRMSPLDRTKAVLSLDAYDKYRKRKLWLEKMYPDTYLRKEHYNDEWEKLN